MTQAKSPEQGTAAFKAFARILGERSPGYVTLLKQTGRLVLTEDGKRIRVAESLELIRATADPGHAGVAARHAATRNAKAGEGTAAPPLASPGGTGEATGADPVATDGDFADPLRFQHWRVRDMKAKALAGERANDVAAGKLRDIAEVEGAIAGAGTTLRSRLESLPAILGPQLAAITDEGQVIAVLAETIEHALEEAARQFVAIGRGAIDAEA